MGSYREPFRFTAGGGGGGGGGAAASTNLPPDYNGPYFSTIRHAVSSRNHFGMANCAPGIPSAQPEQELRYDETLADAHHPGSVPVTTEAGFDILEWHPAYQSCQRYFLDHAQHEPGTQALCALVNIRLPFQWLATPISASQVQQTPQQLPTPSAQQPYGFNPFAPNPRLGTSASLPTRFPAANDQSSPAFVSLLPYIRRLIVTGFDKPAILHGFFGDEYGRGVSPLLDCERRNYLFAAKHGGWRTCKRQYDVGSGGGGDESVPFMKPLDGARMQELTAAEKAWSEWLAMEDWMVGPRAPVAHADASGGSSGVISGRGSRHTQQSEVGTASVNAGEAPLSDGVQVNSFGAR